MTKAKEITNDLVENIQTQKVLFKFLLAGSVIMFSMYIYLVGSITFNVIARKSLENNVVTLTREVNQLDSTYLNKVNSLDKDYALAQGFVESHLNLFAARTINTVAIR